MSQSNVVMAFRKRLRRLGYQEIHIRRIGALYQVSAVEPLGGVLVQTTYSGAEMFHSLQRNKTTVSSVKYRSHNFSTSAFIIVDNEIQCYYVFD